MSADVITPQGVEHNVLTLPVVAKLDARDHVEPEVQRTLVRFEAAKGRAEPNVQEEVDDLETEARRMEARDYVAGTDRKYHLARSLGARDL